MKNRIDECNIKDKISFVGTKRLIFTRYRKKGSVYVREFKKEFLFKQTNEEQIIQKRLNKIPCMVLLCNGELYLAENLPIDGRYIAINPGAHICGRVQEECERLGTDADPYGCAKVRDQDLHKGLPTIEMVEDSKRIEKYMDFIIKGYEIFNTIREVLVVQECKNYCAQRTTRILIKKK